MARFLLTWFALSIPASFLIAQLFRNGSVNMSRATKQLRDGEAGSLMHRHGDPYPASVMNSVSHGARND